MRPRFLQEYGPCATIRNAPGKHKKNPKEALVTALDQLCLYQVPQNIFRELVLTRDFGKGVRTLRSDSDEDVTRFETQLQEPITGSLGVFFFSPIASPAKSLDRSITKR